MKNRLNVVQINGIKGIIFLACAAICLVAGFIVFPGFIMKSGWNLLSSVTGSIPSIGIIQGTLLWGIIIVGFYTFGGRKSLFVEFKSADDLSGAELDQVMQKIRADRKRDLIKRSLIKSRKIENNSQPSEDMINSWKAFQESMSNNVNEKSKSASEEDSHVDNKR